MGNHLFVIFAVLDVSFAVNSCLYSKPQFFYIFVHMYIAFFCYLMGMGDVVSEETVMFYLNLSLF